MVPRTIKISNFHWKSCFGGVLVPAVIFGEPIWRHFGRFWPYSRKFVACVLNSFSSMSLFPKNWGGEGGGKHSFLDHTLQHQTFPQHQNLWLARCGIALQLAYTFERSSKPIVQGKETSNNTVGSMTERSTIPYSSQKRNIWHWYRNSFAAVKWP